MFSWLERRNEKTAAASPAGLDAQDITFIGEQDGPVEQQLKQQLAQLFVCHPPVVQAFLARATIDGQATVVLALRADGADGSGLTREIGAVFASIFNARQHLDIVFLSDAQRAEVGRVCGAFYDRSHV